MKTQNHEPTVYTIIHSVANTANGCFAISTAKGSFLSLAVARKELVKQIAAERKLLPEDYDCEEYSDDFWMMYQDGFAAAAYSKLEIVPAVLCLERSA